LQVSILFIIVPACIIAGVAERPRRCRIYRKRRSTAFGYKPFPVYN